MKRFRLSGNTANWMKGLNMSAISLETLTEETSTTFPANQRMYVSVANNVFHVKDTRREIIKGEISDDDVYSILNALKNGTPDFLLTLEKKVVGYATLHYRNGGRRVNDPVLSDEVNEELTDLDAQYENSEMTDEEYRRERESIIGNFIATIVRPVGNEILVVADITPATPKHSFKKDGMTQTQRDITRKVVAKLLSRLFELHDADSIADNLIEDVCNDIETSADWSEYANDEVNDDDILIALRRVLKSWMAL